MSNGLMSVFVAVMSLAASVSAKTRRHRELAAWIASRDQAVLGRGLAGFDIDDLPWVKASVSYDRSFLLAAIQDAKAKTGWERLDYAPQGSLIMPCLEQLQILLQAFQITDACEAAQASLVSNAPDLISICPVHEIYLPQDGCPICHDC